MKYKGGKVLASGGYGCVFSPALKCEGETKRPTKKISKLMTEKHAIEEYEEINLIKKKLDKIKNYENYYLLYDATICKPAKLTATDLTDYSNKCSALPKDNITKTNINTKLSKLMSLNLPNGGLPVDDYLYENGTFEKIYATHMSLVNLLKKGIVPMNDKNIYHCDIKDSNVLVDNTSKEIKTRLIDWGLSTEYIPFKDDIFPKTWRNRPLQFNVPFSVIIFSDLFVEKYTKFIKDGGTPDESQLKPFVFDFVHAWMKERGAGHYKFINEIMFTLFSNNLTSVSTIDIPKVIETRITMDYIINYIVDVLVHFTYFREDGSLNLREYLDNVFIQIVDVWGFITIYFPIIELLANNYASLSNIEIDIFNMLKYIFTEYLYNPRHEPINMKLLYSDLKDLGDLIHIKLKGGINSKLTLRELSKTSSSKKNPFKKSNPYGVAISIHNKTKKYNNSIKLRSKTRISFKRKPNQKRFKNPFFLSLK